MLRKKVCIITAARSEYGLLHWIIDSVYKDPDLELQLIVTGAHLSAEQGLTYRYIERDGYPITETIPILDSDNDAVSIAKTMGTCLSKMAEAYNRLKPDMVVVLGDRFELIPIVSAALVMCIPIAHIGGGDVTKGAIDDEVRNAISMMATIHFPGVDDAYNNLCRMRGSTNNIFKVGEPGLDSFIRFDLLDREMTADGLNLNPQRKWCIVTLHPETKLSLEENLKMAHNLYKAMCKTQGVQYVISKANIDLGGPAINDYWESVVSRNPEVFQLFSSLGQLLYLSLMKHADLIVGNSSSGIIEAPFLGTPVVNIGNRQEGRHMCPNVISCGPSEEEINDAMQKALNAHKEKDEYWGDGNSSSRICAIIKDYLYESE